jgi:hypothetical protein
VNGADGIGDTEGKSRDGKRQVNREGSELSNLCLGSGKVFKKKACHVFFYSLNPGELLRKKVLTRSWHFRYKGRFTPKIHPH